MLTWSLRNYILLFNKWPRILGILNIINKLFVSYIKDGFRTIVPLWLYLKTERVLNFFGIFLFSEFHWTVIIVNVSSLFSFSVPLDTISKHRIVYNIYNMFLTKCRLLNLSLTVSVSSSFVLWNRNYNVMKIG